MEITTSHPHHVLVVSDSLDLALIRMARSSKRNLLPHELSPGFWNRFQMWEDCGCDWAFIIFCSRIIADVWPCFTHDNSRQVLWFFSHLLRTRTEYSKLPLSENEVADLSVQSPGIISNVYSCLAPNVPGLGSSFTRIKHFGLVHTYVPKFVSAKMSQTKDKMSFVFTKVRLGCTLRMLSHLLVSLSWRVLLFGLV